MRLFSEEVKITSSNSPLNIIQVKDFQEVFFGVFEVQINENKYVVEKISEENGNPIVSILVEEGGVKAQYPFLLLKGKQEIYFNSESEPVEIFESKIENQEDEDLEIKEIVEESFDNSEIFEDKKQQILEEIKRVKRNATKKSLEILEYNKAKKIQEIKDEGKKKEKALKEYLESARENLVDEFTIISGKIKNKLISDNDYKFDEIRESIDLKIQDIADNLSESLKKNFQNSSKLIDKSVKQLVKELYESNINPKVDKELHNIAEEIVEKVSEIDKNLNNKLDKKADVSLLEGVNKEIDAIRDANIELNNSLNKGVQKALSRVGNVDKKILEISEKFDNKISQTEQEITQYFDEKLSLIKEETLDITDEARKYFQDLIQESRNGLLSEIRKIKNEKPVEYILESKKGEPIVKDWDSIEKEWNKKIHDKFENYKTDLRKYVAVYASGGGTNATQYQDGGTMNGDLTIVGKLSAGEYLGITIPSGEYLPLSGGTVTGNVSVSGLLSANRIGFNTGAGLTAGTGQLTWNDANGTLELGLKGGVVKTEIGQGLVTRVVNKTTPNVDLLGANYQVVVIGGATGQRLSVKLAQANNDANSAGTLGIVAEDILKNQEGFVVTVGLLKDRNTTGSLQGETWNDGDILYLSPTVAGRITNIKPQAPNHTVIVGYVEYAHQNNGKIYVKIDNGYELDELHNVRIASVSANDVLKYNSTSRVWENSNTLTLSSLSATRIFTTQLDALSANISVIDITRYELSGFNVTGDVTINGSVSSQNISAGDVYTNGVRVATAVDPVRTTLTGNGVLSTFAISGAANLINPSALIVAIDGALQEPSVDYLVNNGVITFTSPLPNGSKAVVIAPSNSLIAGQVVPSDGSVTSAKIAGGQTISDLTLASSTTFNSTSYTYGAGAASAHRASLGIVSVSALIPVFYAYATLYTYNVSNQTTNRLWKNTTAIQTAPAITPSANFTKGTRGEIIASGSTYIFNNVNSPSPSTTYEAPYTLLVVLRPTAQTTNNGIFRHRNWDPNYTTGNLLQARFFGDTYQVLTSKVVPTTDFVCIAYTGNNLVQRAAIWHNNEIVSGSSVVTMTANQSLIDMQINAGGGGTAGGVEFVAAQGLYGMLSETDLRAYAEAFFKSVIN